MLNNIQTNKPKWHIHAISQSVDKISQNLAHLEANSHKINFQSILQHILWKNKHKSHLVVFITSFLHINKGFLLLWGSFKVIFVKISQNFIKSHLKICLISQISVHSLWHVWWQGNSKYPGSQNDSWSENTDLVDQNARLLSPIWPSGLRQANLVLIAYASSEGSGEPAHPRSLARTFAARSYKQWVKRNLQTENQIPGPSEWLGMHS